MNKTQTVNGRSERGIDLSSMIFFSSKNILQLYPVDFIIKFLFFPSFSGSDRC